MEENKKNKIPNVPNLRFDNNTDWKQYKLKQLSKIYDGTHQTPDYKNEGIKFVSVEDINDLYATSKFITNEAFTRDFKVAPKQNDILMTRIGDIGSPAIVIKDEPLAYYVSLALIKPLDNLNSLFAKYMIESINFQHELWKRTIHVAFPKKINKEEIGECLCFVPELSVQQKIGSFLSLIDKRIETQNKILNGLESLRFSLSYILFRHLDRYSKLEDIANIIKGKQINGDILNDDFSYPVYNGGINASGFYNKFNSENCITISEGGNSCGTVRFVKDKFWSGGHNYVIVCKNGIIDQFLYYYLKHNENKIMSLRVGSGLPNIQKSSLSEFKIKITNIEEQKKIAAKLGAIDSKINNEKKLLELFQKQKIFLLNNLFI